MVWRPREAPLPPAPGSGRGRPGTQLRRDATHQPVSATTLALEVAADAWQQITWRDGSNTPLTSRFARWRVRPAHDDSKRSEPAGEEWLLVEWPECQAEPDHYWLATLSANISFERLVDQTKLSWRIERDYLELTQEVGLGHYEGRGWRGFAPLPDGAASPPACNATRFSAAPLGDTCRRSASCRRRRWKPVCGGPERDGDG